MSFQAKQLLASGVLIVAFSLANAGPSNCPDPNTSSLSIGVIPAPWFLNPFSSDIPQISKDSHFVKAAVLVAGVGRGVMCSYENAGTEFSIWWPGLAKIPASVDYQWIKAPGGYLCSQSLINCSFSTF